MFPKTGKVLPNGIDRDSDGYAYAELVAGALRRELGTTHRAAKTIVRWTGASERTVKHWLHATHGPDGAYLIALLRESESVFDAVLQAAQRSDCVVAARILAAQGPISEAMAILGKVRVDASQQLTAERSAGLVVSDVRGIDRETVPQNDPLSNLAADGLNPRQCWFLAALGSGRNVRVGDLQRRWVVSEKTARRDIAGLKAAGKVIFVGSARGGKYQLQGHSRGQAL